MTSFDEELLREIYGHGGREAMEKVLHALSQHAAEDVVSSAYGAAARVVEGAVASNIARLDQAEARNAELEAEIVQLQAEIDELVDVSLDRFFSDPQL